MSIDSTLSDALTIRLNLSVSVSSLPFVEEWMDAKLGEWLDSIPLPPEMGGEPAQFVVTVGSDLSRVRWSASGSPAGFIPKMAEYFQRAKVGKAEMDRIDALGAGLEPEVIGSWIEVRRGAIYHGWQLLDRENGAEVLGLIGADGAAVADAVAKTGLLSCTRIARQIGSGYQLDFELTGAPPSDALHAAAPVLTAFGGSYAPPEGEYVNRDVAQTRVIAVIGDAAEASAGLTFGATSDQAASLASAIGCAYADASLDQVRRSLGSAGVIGARLWAADSPLIDLDFLPGTQRGELRAAN